MTRDMGQLVNLSVHRGIPFKDTAGLIVLQWETGLDRLQSVKVFVILSLFELLRSNSYDVDT